MVDRPISEELMPALYTNAGMIVLNWTLVESSFDHWTAIAFHSKGGSELEAELPRMFGRKMTFLSKAFKRLPGLAPFASEALVCVGRANKLSELRHYVAHGMATHFDADNDETFTFQKTDITDDKQWHYTGTLRVKGSDLAGASVELTKLAQQTQALTLRLLETLEP